MPFTIPTVADLATRAAGAFRAYIKGTDAALWPNNIAVSAKVMAGAVWEAFSFLDYISRQINKSTAEGAYLERHAADYGLARLTPTRAEGQALLRGDPGVLVPSGLVLTRADGVVYDTLSGGALTTDPSPPTGAPSGVVSVAVRARLAGRAGNAFPGTALALVGAIDRISGDAAVAAAGIGSGADTESDDGLRQRLLFRLQNPPHGGAAHDYQIWAREVAGVTRVTVDPVTITNARTTVGVYFMMDQTYPDGIPQGADVATVAAYIEPLRPAGAAVAVQAPTAVPVAITISGLAPNTARVRAAVEAELAALFAEDVPVSTLTVPFTLRVAKLWETIAVASGGDSHAVTLPAGDVAVPSGSVATLGTVSYA